MRFSILMINFNGSRTLARAINSALNQTYRDVEVICVDDASTDESREILKAFEAEHNNFHAIFHEKNSGMTCGRLSGIGAATGDYLLFLDSDDALEEHCCSTLAEVLAQKSYDMLSFGTEVVFQSVYSEEMKQSIEVFFRNPCEELMGNAINEAFLTGKINFTVWNKCYKKSLIDLAVKEIKRDYINLCEDYYFNFLVEYFTTSYFGIEEKLIRYSYGEGISTAKKIPYMKFVQSVESSFRAHKNCSDFIAKYRLPEFYTKSVESHEGEVFYGFIEKLRCLSDEERDTAAEMLLEKLGKRKFISLVTRFGWFNPKKIMDLIDFSALFKRKNDQIKTVGLYNFKLYNGGTESLISRMSFMLAERGYRVAVITDEKENPLDYPLAEGTTRICLNEKYPVPDGSGYARRFDKFTSCIEENSIDVVIYNPFASDYGAWDMCTIKSAGAAFVPFCHSVYIAGLIDGWDGITGKQESYRYADAIITLSAADRLFWSRVNKNTYQITNPLPDIQKRIDECDRQAHTVLWVGRLDDGNKNPTDALHIFYRVVQHIPDAKMYMCGYATEDNQRFMRGLTKSLGIADNVVFTGYITDMQEYYNKAVATLCTSNFEGFSLVVAESLSSGVPVVTYELPYMTMTKRSDAVVNVEWRNFDAAADALVTLLSDGNVHKFRSKAAVEEAEMYKKIDLGHTWEQIFDDLQSGGKTANPAETSDIFELIAASELAFRQTNWRIRTLRNELYDCRRELAAVSGAYQCSTEEYEAKIREIYASKRYRVGRAVAYLPSKAKRFVEICRESGLSYGFRRLIEKVKKVFRVSV